MQGFNRVASTAERLKLAMDRAGKIQADLVRETGVDRGALSNYLKGNYEPKQDVIHKLAIALNVSEMWLWGYDCDSSREAEPVATTEETKKSVIDDGLTEEQKTLIEFARSLPEDKAALALRLLQSIVEVD